MQQPGWQPAAAGGGELETASTFERIFTLYREQAGLLLPAAPVLFLPIAILQGIARNGGGVALALIGTLLSVVATFWFQGMVVQAVADMRDGRRDFTIGTLFQSAAPF